MLKFETRQQFEEFYIDRVKIDKEIVNDLSKYMVDVRTIVSYGLEDSNRRFLGVVSIDLRELVRTKNTPDELEEQLAEISDGDNIIEFDELRIRDVLRSMQSIMDAFAKAK